MQIHTEKGIHKGIHLVWIFFHKHSPFTGQQGRGRGRGGEGGEGGVISVTLIYHFHPLYRQLDINRALTAHSQLLGSNQKHLVSTC